MLDNLSVMTFRVHLRVTGSTPLRLTGFPGSTFHGALGWALGRVKHGRSKACRDCPIAGECRYTDLFSYLFRAPADHPLLQADYARLLQQYDYPELRGACKELPPPYILDPPPGGEYEPEESLELGITLVGQAIKFFPFLACGLEEMAAGRIGGNAKRVLQLEQITAKGIDEFAPLALVYDRFADGMTDQGAELIDLKVCAQWAENKSLQADYEHVLQQPTSPLKFKKQGKVRSNPDFIDLIRLLHRRILLLSVHSPVHEQQIMDLAYLLDLAASVQGSILQHDFGYIERGSIRKGKEWKDRRLFGAINVLTFTMPPTPLLSLLKLGEFIHIGKAATLGFGGYYLDFIEADFF